MFSYRLDWHDKPSSVVDDHLSRRSITRTLKRRSGILLSKLPVRPCTEVRILPFHSGIAAGTLCVRASILSKLSVSVRTSRLAADGYYPLPMLRTYVRLCSDFPQSFSVDREVRGRLCQSENYYITFLGNRKLESRTHFPAISRRFPCACFKNVAYGNR